MSMYGIVAKYQSFVNVTSYKDTTDKIPFGYHFDAHRWTYLYNTYTDNLIGKVIVNINYHNVGKVTGGYFTYSIVVFIEKEYDVGTIEFAYNLKTPIATTVIPPSIDLYNTLVAGSLAYYLQPMTIRLYNDKNTKIYYKFDFLPKTIPLTISNSEIMHVSLYSSTLQDFRDISQIDQKVVQIPFGYHFKDIKWTNIINPNNNNNIIGKIILVNNFHNTDTLANYGYCNDNVIVYIEKELPIGSLGYTLNFINPKTSTNFIEGTTVYPTITALTGQYYGKYITVMMNINIELIDIYFTITPPL